MLARGRSALGWLPPLGADGTASGLTALATRLSVEFTKFVFRSLKDFALLGWKLLAGTVDIEVEHRHGGAKRGALAPVAVVGGRLEGQGDPARVIPGEHARFEIQSVTGLSDLLGPTFELLLEHQSHLAGKCATGRLRTQEFVRRGADVPPWAGLN